MAGAYCRFCDHRCFVDRRMPADAKWRPGEVVHLATCPAGAAYDRQQTGYTYATTEAAVYREWLTEHEGHHVQVSQAKAHCWTCGQNVERPKAYQQGWPRATGGPSTPI